MICPTPSERSASGIVRPGGARAIGLVSEAGLGLGAGEEARRGVVTFSMMGWRHGSRSTKMRVAKEDAAAQ